MGPRRRRCRAGRAIRFPLGNHRSRATHTCRLFAYQGRLKMDRVGVGIVGLGNISGAYLKAAKEFFPILDIRAVADLNPDAAKAKADEFGLKAVPLDDIFKAPDVEIILNLTIPRAHVNVGLRAIDAGKHVYSEKPLGVEFAQGQKLVAAGKAK